MTDLKANAEQYSETENSFVIDKETIYSDLFVGYYANLMNVSIDDAIEIQSMAINALKQREKLRW